MSTGRTSVLPAFGLADYERILAGAFDLTRSYISGVAALYWYLNDFQATTIPADIELGIFCDPRPASIGEENIVAIFAAIFTAAGYRLRLSDTPPIESETHRVYNIGREVIWDNITLGRKIRLLIRRPDTPIDAPPLYALGAFDICQLFVTTTSTGYLGSFYSDDHSDVDDDTIIDIRERQMRLGHLKGHDLSGLLLHLANYYARGFAFREHREVPCSCLCGHAHTTKKLIHLTLEEAIAYVTEEYHMANPAQPPPETESVGGETIIPPSLEIPRLEIRDLLEATTPPRPKRLIRKDAFWIRPTNSTEKE